MGFSETNKNWICKILQITPIQLRDNLYFLGDRLTAEIQTDIETEITRWTTGGKGTKFTKIKPGSESLYADIDPDREKQDIKANIAVLLEMPEWVNGGASSSVQGMIYRG